MFHVDNIILCSVRVIAIVWWWTSFFAYPPPSSISIIAIKFMIFLYSNRDQHLFLINTDDIINNL